MHHRNMWLDQYNILLQEIKLAGLRLLAAVVHTLCTGVCIHHFMSMIFSKRVILFCSNQQLVYFLYIKSQIVTIMCLCKRSMQMHKIKFLLHIQVSVVHMVASLKTTLTLIILACIQMYTCSQSLCITPCMLIMMNQ